MVDSAKINTLWTVVLWIIDIRKIMSERDFRFFPLLASFVSPFFPLFLFRKRLSTFLSQQDSQKYSVNKNILRK